MGDRFDQIVAGSIGDATRISSLELACGAANGTRMSFTTGGIALPTIDRPSVLYSKMFGVGMDKRRQEYLLDSHLSVLDLVLDDAKRLQNRINGADRAKLAEYFSSVREVERKLQKQRQWLKKPRPEVDFRLPDFDPIAPALLLECEEIMYDLIGLALQTDSTRVISLLIPGAGQVFTLEGRPLVAGYHGLSHHNNDPGKVRDLVRVDIQHARNLGRLLRKLQETKDEQDRALLDSTIVLFGSGMGDASVHSNRNLPILVAGGGLKHGKHIRLDPEDSGQPVLLGDLFLTLMQQLGVEIDTFGGASRNLNQFLM